MFADTLSWGRIGPLIPESRLHRGVIKNLGIIKIEKRSYAFLSSPLHPLIAVEVTPAHVLQIWIPNNEIGDF